MRHKVRAECGWSSYNTICRLLLFVSLPRAIWAALLISLKSMRQRWRLMFYATFINIQNHGTK